MSARRQQTAEAVQTAVADAVCQASRALESLRSTDGYWPVHPIPGEACGLDAMIRAYVSVKRNGRDQDRLNSMRQSILAQGGLSAASPEVKLELGVLGLYPHENCPVLLEPDKLPVWTRTTLVSLSILHALGVRQPSRATFDINELLSGLPKASRSFRVELGFLRRRALKRAENWLIENSGAFASVYATMALEALGHRPNQAAGYTPARETALAARTLPDCSLTAEWLLKHQVGGWHSGHASERYPDADTTAAAVLALSKAGANTKPGTQWLLKTQAKDGGWAAFDPRTESSAHDVTGHVLEALSDGGFSADHPQIARGVEYLFRSQEQDGSWSGCWGVNYTYGTFRVLRGLQAVGLSDREASVLRAGEWLRSIQNPDGGWGESCESYFEKMFVPTASTPSQTAWAVLGLLAGGDETSLSVNQGIEYLVDTQREDGTWDERTATAAGVPGASFQINPLYRIVFPLLALSSFLERGMRVAH